MTASAAADCQTARPIERGRCNASVSRTFVPRAISSVIPSMIPYWTKAAIAVAYG